MCGLLYNNNYQDVLFRSDDEESDEEDHSSPSVLCGNVYDLINKIRSVVRIFRKSRIKIMQFYNLLSLKEQGKALKLILNCKTRCSSLLWILERFLML